MPIEGEHPDEETHSQDSPSLLGSHGSLSSEMQDHRRHQSMRRRSDASNSSHTPSRLSRSLTSPVKRPRGFSRSSTRSDAVSFRSKVSGFGPPQGPGRSKSTNADDSEAESTKSLGETDEDVCFPMDDVLAGPELEETGVKVAELDQLLNLSSDEDYTEVPQVQEEVEHAAILQPGTYPLGKEEQQQLHQDLEKEREHKDFDRKVTNSSEDGPDSDATNNGSSSSEEMKPPSSVRSTFRPTVVEDDIDVNSESQRFSFFSANRESTIHASDLASLVEDGASFSSLFNRDYGVWWLDCYCPTDMEMRVLSRAFGIHPLTTEDIRTEESREKFEMFKKYYLVIYHTFESDPKKPNYMEAINFYIIVFQDGVISFHFSPVTHCANVRRRMRQLRDYVSVSTDWICYALMDDITDSFAPVIQRIEAEADFVEDSVYLNTGHSAMNGSSDLLRRLGEGRKQTMTMVRLLSGKADVVRMFSKRCNDENNMPGSDMAMYLGDIQDHIITMFQNLSAYEKIFSRTHFNYMGLLQMEFVNSSNRMTTVLGKVTVVGTVLVPMNLITGMFGMNVRVPGEDGSNLGWFFGILGVILLMIAGLSLGGTYYFRRVQRLSEQSAIGTTENPQNEQSQQQEN